MEVNEELFKQCILAYYNCSITDVDVALSYWKYNKRNLYKMFGNQLKFDVPVTVDEAFFFTQVFDKREESGFLEYLNSLCSPNEKDNLLTISRLMTTQNIACGSLVHELSLSRNGTTLKLPSGMKTMRAIRKVMEFLGGDRYIEFENFRDSISVIRTYVGKEINMTFSIDPVDFLIMSENNHGWRTCYSKGGSHHMGPIAWMNSPYAIVAYINDSSHSTFDLNGYKLPNMSWRTMYLVGENFISSGLSYPMDNDGLIRSGLNALIDRFNLYHLRSCPPILYDESDDFVYDDWMENADWCFYSAADMPGREVCIVDHPTCLCCGKHIDGEYDDTMENYCCCADCLERNRFNGVVYSEDQIVEFDYAGGFRGRIAKDILETDFYLDRFGQYALKPMLEKGGLYG